jgi:hypothetical protein
MNYRELQLSSRLSKLGNSSLVESEHPVGEAHPEADNTIDTPETSVLSVNPSQQLLVSTIAEGSVS